VWATADTGSQSCSVCIISIARCIDLAKAATTPDPDLTWRAVSTANWTMVEINAAVVCACLTTLKPLLGRVFPRLLASYRPSNEGDPEMRSSGRTRGRRGRHAHSLELDTAHSIEADTVHSHKSTTDSSAKTGVNRI
jgi:hypothetical protein